ncbi:iron-containing alcohol dehydrogenase [Nocardiopsis sp. RSe5-2]|uniref:Iron-containing alcohol dehydrogenase n=1 Tax=Nocardiopsis endophytica TaxID=3018445 RepID=A0ABT4U9B6_9ACTN|nr:iron-containing alcohol dehydrogenase [Nocardiopsis endophytica]MDA2813550.1 iron-containing alcohol dehydrogenase [Nocardiopsis endophytica]
MTGRALEGLSERTEVRFGRGALDALGEVLEERGARRVLVVHGRSSFRSGTQAERVARAAPDVRFFGGIRPNPGVDQVAEAVSAARRFAPDAVVGIGGGSAMDAAKAVAVLAAPGAGGADVSAHLRSPELVRWPRVRTLVLVPTVSGSGSELTRFATVYEGGRKRSLDHPECAADAALVDPDLTASVPPHTAAASALDAFCQGVESYWSVAGTEASRELALGAVETVVPPLLRAVGGTGGAGGMSGAGGTGGTDGAGFADPGLREELAQGALMAGAAIDRTRTTAAHALSYGLTAGHGVPHGYAVGLHLRWLVGHNGAVTEQDNRHPDGAGALRGLVERVRSACRHAGADGVEHLVGRVLAFGGMPGSVPEHGGWAEALASRRAGNNPRAVTERDVLRAMTER